MSAQNAVRVFFHEHFVAGICFRNPPRRIPGRGHLLLDPELKVLLTCPAFTETDSRQRGDREDDRRNAEVIWSLMVAKKELVGFCCKYEEGNLSWRCTLSSFFAASASSAAARIRSPIRL